MHFSLKIWRLVASNLLFCSENQLTTVCQEYGYFFLGGASHDSEKYVHGVANPRIEDGWRTEQNSQKETSAHWPRFRPRTVSSFVWTVLWRRRRSKVHSSLTSALFVLHSVIFSFPGNWVPGSKLRVAGVTAGLAESNGSLSSGLWLTSPAGWLPRTGISSGTQALQRQHANHSATEPPSS